MVTEAGARWSRGRPPSLVRLRLAASSYTSAWSAPAWGAMGVTAAFIALTCWWLTQDRSVPIFDAGLHLSLAIQVHEALSQGHLHSAFSATLPYPPFAYLVGALGITLGGVGVAPLIITENLVFVSLLSLGCYNVARLAFGPLAGLLAVVFALGSPLISAQFRVFMIDAPETAMVAVSVWLVLATEGFSRIRYCILAGLAFGLGMLTKEPFPMFVVGVVGVALWRGGRRSWRGFAVFAAIALAIALPWYVSEFHEIRQLGSEAGDSSAAFAGYQIAGVAPPRLSLENLTWYLWNFVNAQLYLPLFLFAAVGWVWTLLGFLRRRPVSRLAIEVSVGAFVGWALVTETFIHDTRYSMPLLVYLAVFGAGWIVRLPRRGRTVAACALAVVALANTLGAAFGLGSQLRVTLPGARADTLQQPGTITFYENQGFLVSAPKRDGDLLGMLTALKRGGTHAVILNFGEATGADFSEDGVYALAQIAGLEPLAPGSSATALTSSDAVLAHWKIRPGEAPPCVRLDDGTGVWVRLGDPLASGSKDFCPLPKPHFYG
jgi:hypothetical protein